MQHFYDLHGCDSFMQYIAPCHKKKKIKWMEEYNIHLDKPENSPDLNPIESSWNCMMNQLTACDTSFVLQLT